MHETPTSLAASRSCDSGVDDGSIVPLEALVRVAAAAALYPPVHPRIAQVAAPLLAAARSAPDDAPLAILVRTRRSSGHDALECMRSDLRALGIARIELTRDVSVPDLVEFARFLRRHAGSRADSFHQADLSDVPATIRIRERRFSAAPTDDPEPGAASPIDGVTPAEADEDVIAAVREVIASALAGSGAPAAGAADPEGVPTGRRATIRAVAEAVRRWIEHRTDFTNGRATPAEVLADAERSLPQTLPDVNWAPVFTAIRRTIDSHLRDAFRAEAPAGFDAARTIPRETESHVVAGEVASALRLFTDAAEPFGPPSSGDRAANVSVLLHLVGDGDCDLAAEEANRRLASCLAEPLGHDELAVLVGWLRELTGCADAGELDRRLVVIAAPLRQMRRSSFAGLLLAACEPPHRALAEALWPHLALALVVRDEARPESEADALASIVAGVPRDRFLHETERLRRLVGDGVGAPEERVFFPPRESLHPLYAALIEMPRPAGFTELVTRSFARHAPSHPAAAALNVLPPNEERTRLFLARILRDGPGTAAGVGGLAAQILASALRGLNQRRRGEAWVEPAIRALARLPFDVSEEMLGEVRSGRGLLRGWTWPPGARQAALEAAADFRRRARDARGGAGAGSP